MTPRGVHWIIDLFNVPQHCCTDAETWLEAFKTAAQLIDAEVISAAYHQFEPPKPPGATAFLMLDASHFSVHTYAESQLAALDLFVCARNELGTVLSSIMNDLALAETNVSAIRKIGRFETSE
jgi:S-adenosylmethionine decarboxylase